MMRLLRSTAVAVLLCGVGVGAASAAATQDGNLLIDGRFDTDQPDFPEFWSRSSTTNIVYDRTGGPEGKLAAIGLRGEGPTTGTLSVRQLDLALVAGEPYKLSGYIRTQGFQSRSAGLILHNAGWVSSSGITKLPADSDWTYVERTFTLFPSTDNRYGVAMYAIDPVGEIYFADVKLEALSAQGRANSRSQWTSIASPKLVPIAPLLNRIPHDDPRLTFRLFGSLPAPREAYDCVVAVGGQSQAARTLPIKDGEIRVRLEGLPRGDYSLEAAIRHRETQQAVLRRTFAISIVDIPAVDSSGVKPLNSLVSELLDQPLRKTSEDQTFSFVNPRDGWIFVAVTTEVAAPELAVRIDDGQPVITAATDRHEAFRELARGGHRITVGGSSADARLIVRSIPEIFDYPPCTNSFVRENGPYDWAFTKQHILPAVTTFNGGNLRGDALIEAQTRGLKWLASYNVEHADDADTMRQKMERHAGMTQPQYAGFTSDELFFGRSTLATYAAALWGLNNPDDRLVYTWIVGQPSIVSLHTDFMSACLNASRGRGRLLFEAYCHPQADEATAARHLDQKVGETMRKFNAFVPNAAAGTGIIFGSFNQIPIISLEHNPAVDFKYYLDMQVNLIANSPDFAGLATTGYWGTYYGDEELVRWSFKLMRHYAVEGRKEMLSHQYGFKYLPGFLANGDFADGLNEWTVSAAAKDAIRPAAVAGYGKNCQGRWGAGSAGDTVCVLARQDGQPNRLSQIAHGLQVGKAYCLQFVTADLNDVVQHKHNPRRYGIDVELEGAEVLAARSFVHVDRRGRHRTQDPDHLGKINLHRLVFRAKSATQSVVFHDTAAVPGEELILNFVQLKPYLE